MKVAIIGAGMSGLACAITLEKHGISPTIFENRSKVGDRFVNGELLMNIFDRPTEDSIATLADKHHIYLKPRATIQKLQLFSKNKAASINGHLGYINLRGRHEESFESQLEQQTNATIHYHSKKTYEQLRDEYTHVVIATGDGDDAEEQHNFRKDLTVSIKGAIVEGVFDENTVMAWLDYDLAPFGYCYLIPFSKHEANFSLAIPDLPKNAGVNTEDLFDQFYAKVKSQFNQEFPITDQFQITRYPMGICLSPRVGNTFYVGNAFGTMAPFLGFGQYPSILSGVYAAYDLVGLGKYEKLTEPLRKSYENSLVLRRTMESLTNKGLDRLVSSVDGYLGDKAFQKSSIDLLKIASYVLRPFVKQN